MSSDFSAGWAAGPDRARRHPGARGAGVALFAFALFFGQAVGVHLAGQVIESNGYTPVFVIAALGLVLLALRFSAWIRRRQLVGN